MKKKYESPDLEIAKIIMTADVLTISKGENTASSGFYIDPDSMLEEMEEP